MQRGLVLSALVGLAVFCIATPISPANQEVLSPEVNLQTQATLVLAKVDSQGKFKNLIPLIKQSIVYSSLVLPVVRASRDHVKPRELTENLLVQTMSDAGGKDTLEKYLPTAEDTLDAIIAIGNVVGGSSGFNPVELMTNVVGKADMVKAMDEVMKFPFRFPDPTPQEVEAAEGVVLSIGLGYEDQEQAVNRFLGTLTPEQKSMLDTLQKDVIEKLTNAITTPTGEPTPALISEIKRQMAEMERKTGSTSMMPEEIKDMVKKADAEAASTPAQAPKLSSSDPAQVQALIAIKGDSSTGKFKNFVPLVEQVVIYSSAILPSVRASKEHKRNSELSPLMLVQTVETAAGATPAASTSDMTLPSAESMLDAMKKIGKVMGGSSGYNPVELMTNVVGDGEMKVMINKIMEFPMKFPDLTEDQLSTAEQVALAAGLGFETQEQALGQFMGSLNAEQRGMIDDMRMNVYDKLTAAIMLPDGQPTQKFVDEVKRQMQVMQQTKGSTEMMPDELKDLVKTADTKKVSADEAAQLQSLVAVQPSTSKFQNLLPLMKQVVTYATVLPRVVKQGKDHLLSSSLLVQSSPASGSASVLSSLEKDLPTSSDMLDAMLAIGNVLGGSSGFNPIKLVTNAVGGKAQMEHVIELVMKFPLKFPELSDSQLQSAEQLLMSAGMGFTSQEDAINSFIRTLNDEQKQMITQMQQEVFDKVVNSLMTPEGNPTPALVEEIKSQMREMETKTGSTNMMPEELKSLVAPTQN